MLIHPFSLIFKVAWRQVEKEKFLTIGTTTWIKDNNYVVQHKEDEVTDITVWNLKIKNVKTEMAGEYECQTTAIAGHSRIVYLQVVGSPLSKPGKIDFGHLHKYKYSSSNLRLTGNKFVEQGHKIHLTCNATGGDRIPEEIDWFKDGDLIEPHKYSDIIITKYRSLEVKALVSELIVDHSDRSHAGTYICRSSQDKIDKLTVEVLVAWFKLTRSQQSPNIIKRAEGSDPDPRIIFGSFRALNYSVFLKEN
ncbi:hypothetical protein LOTGIDRAFT_166438 [Lottia gigantea]|uniref:Ig-like domain-containing protein n=1 Tax=Lottia gigantea TaxID=225164 RepID=V3Z9G6_LOTGI|nr:hypothetical protein LOTGIDRAFT_166438 [Lottia gigantea]ESO87558.1 hypothetical protein LOTGIDRAFT_166438 [Lottia gigantea]